jgi:hypothetical protein
LAVVTTLEASSGQANCVRDFSMNFDGRPQCKETVADLKHCTQITFETLGSASPPPYPAVCGQLQQDCYGDMLMPGH